MATLALSPEAAIMDIIGHMAVTTSCRSSQFFATRWGFMTFITGNSFMATIQLEFCALIMIKIPNFPISCIMAGVALSSQAKLMHIFLFMATETL